MDILGIREQNLHTPSRHGPRSLAAARESGTLHRRERVRFHVSPPTCYLSTHIPLSGNEYDPHQYQVPIR